MDGMAINLSSVALRERKKGNPELAAVIDVAAREIERYRRGIKEIGEHLRRPSPRVGDASFIVEALLAE